MDRIFCGINPLKGEGVSGPESNDCRAWRAPASVPVDIPIQLVSDWTSCEWKKGPVGANWKSLPCCIPRHYLILGFCIRTGLPKIAKQLTSAA